MNLPHFRGYCQRVTHLERKFGVSLAAIFGMNCQTILVVEDDAYIRESLVEILRMEGFAACSVPNGEEAFSFLGKMKQPVLVLLDMNMPVISGWEFLARREKHSSLKQHPVVIVSAVPDHHALLNEGNMLKAEGLLSKPIQIENLLKVAQQYCIPQTELLADQAG